MTRSTSNDNGRYYEYLLTELIISKYGVVPSIQTKQDQARDRNKNIKEKTKKDMVLSLSNIENWLNKVITLDKKCIIERLPDKNLIEPTHDDIKIIKNNEELGFSLKHNHESIFHGRAFTCHKWCGLPDKDPLSLKYLNSIGLLNNALKEQIFPLTKFSVDKNILEEYKEPWSSYARDMFEEMSHLINNVNGARELYKRIIGHGSSSYRILKKPNSKKIIVQNLKNLTEPSSVCSSVQQRNKSDKWWVWQLNLDFSNGLKIEARSKWDTSVMTKKNSNPPLKPDWVVADWGRSGMTEEEYY